MRNYVKHGYPNYNGDKNPHWRGGRRLKGGYWVVCAGNGKEQYEHRLVVEQALGRKLKTMERVHHINCRKLDNRNRNLLVCDQSYHHMLHDKMSKLYAQEHF